MATNRPPRRASESLGNLHGWWRTPICRPRFGRFTIYGFTGRGPQEEAVALVRGNPRGRTAPLVRVHSQCLTGDVLSSQRCDCRAQLELSLKKIGQASSGILLYLPQEGRASG